MRPELIAHRNPKSPNSEIFRTLRTNIQFMNTNKKIKTLLITSTFPSEGKSWVAANLAVTFAQTGKKVILVDADMRKGRQYRIFEISPKPGLSNYLSEVEIYDDGKTNIDVASYVQETEVDNLYTITAGSVPPNPSELLVSSKMLKLLEDLKQICDLIIIDGTPCELVADSIILSRIVDCTIVVAGYKITKKDALERVIKNIQNVGGNLAGIVLNKMASNKKYGREYYYYGDSSKNIHKKRDVLKSIKKHIGNQNKYETNSDLEKNIAMLYEKVDVKNDEKVENPNISENIVMPKIETNSPINNTEKTIEEKTEDIMQQINSYIEKQQ